VRVRLRLEPGGIALVLFGAMVLDHVKRPAELTRAVVARIRGA
jgi:hypothetical protein